ncbi:hypothetical protein BCR37DRAFT_384207 [Protomyces lactucae-debilis]|uniref:HNH domain-containing protein n=1 Tax=Protomyces lactucae-debilis TaxID=2754530 RepID=A0A1Y2EU93_PROLT|nr:uncharacterized protein BCR37DRAFT_384207 [Protomyces lactucae-debilis]ORY75142.1 hypothetical protein BCR37DRAFT_384207 [Protomyces lactucae-debilis]
MPLTVHHLIPKSEHSRLLSRQSASLTRSWLLSSENTAAVCRPCHTAIHRIMSNEHLAERGKTIEALCKDEDILKWITFARGQRTSDLKTGHHKGLKYRR